MVFEYILKKNGIDPQTDLNINQGIDFGSTAAAFSEGSGDFTVEFEPSATALEMEGKGYVVASLGTDSGYVPYTAFSAKKSYLKENPDVIQRFKSASCSRPLTSSAVPAVSLTSISPSRLIFCVILSRGFSFLLNSFHLRSAPLQGCNSHSSVQCRCNGGQGFLPQAPSCRCRKTGQAQCRPWDSPPKCRFPPASAGTRRNARPCRVRC